MIAFAGGGEGVTVLVNEPFANHPELGSGQVIIYAFPAHYSESYNLIFTSCSTQKRFII
jgi:hypothetical protein